MKRQQVKSAQCGANCAGTGGVATGFTLVELLVVIAIIALLAAILFPVFGTAREKSRQITCASNLRQLGLGILQYSADYDESLPSGSFQYAVIPTTCGGANVDLPDGEGWASQIYPYVKAAGAFVCPDDTFEPLTGTRTINSVNYATNAVSYAFNMNLSQASSGTWCGTTASTLGGPPLVISRLNSPTQTVMLWELGPSYYTQVLSVPGLFDFSVSSNIYNSPNEPMYARSGYIDDGYACSNSASHGQNSSCYADTGSTESQVADPIGIHSNSSNFLCADGHVKWLPSNEVSGGTNAQSPNAPERQAAGSDAEGTQAGKHQATFSFV